LRDGHGEIEVRFRHFKTGEARWMAYKVVTLTDAAGQPVALATVSQDITVRKALEDNLRSLAGDLSEADRRKDEFLAILAHELRNPLAVIHNAVQVQLRASGDAKAVASTSEMLERQIGQMGRLVDDLLDMSRITQGKIELRRERVALTTVVAQAVEAARPFYKSRRHELTVALPQEEMYLDADPARVAQVVGNLLSNAGKFTDDGGRIWLSVERDDWQAVIRVRDTGIGIAVEELPRLFDMFTQVDSSLERTREGLGIGLTLVKTLVEMHGGTVEARSEGLGRGSEFVVRLPILAEASIPHPRETIRGPTVRRRVLIVDDNEDSAESLAMLLQLSGHETHVAHDGLEATEMAQCVRPDVILLDIGLPGLNGYQVCRRIREQPWGRDLTLVAVTGWGQQKDRQRAREAGFDTHIVKPVDHEDLLKLLDLLPPRQTSDEQEETDGR
jgi:signal transduction histidine kinase/ActR/RegA family two-component response regulator